MSSPSLPECDLVEKHSLSRKVTKGKNKLINAKHLTHNNPKRIFIKKKKKAVVTHAYNPSTWEAEARDPGA